MRSHAVDALELAPGAIRDAASPKRLAFTAAGTVARATLGTGIASAAARAALARNRDLHIASIHLLFTTGGFADLHCKILQNACCKLHDAFYSVKLSWSDVEVRRLHCFGLAG